MGKIHGVALLLFAWAMIGADDCALTQIGKSPPPEPAMPFCTTDPPLGCAAICTDVDVIDFTAPCGNIEAGPRTEQFEADVGKALENASANGIQVCPDSRIGATLTPCQDGITPVEWPNQDHEVCKPPPPGCPLP